MSGVLVGSISRCWRACSHKSGLQIRFLLQSLCASVTVCVCFCVRPSLCVSVTVVWCLRAHWLHAHITVEQLFLIISLPQMPAVQQLETLGTSNHKFWVVTACAMLMLFV